MRGFLVYSWALLVTAGLAGGLIGSPAVHASGDERPGQSARAELKDPEGRRVGQAHLRESPHGVVIQLELENAPAGTRAFHIHETGRCEAPEFESAGDHFAPRGQQHGFLNARGPHAGDLPNLHIPQSGRLSVELFARGVTLADGEHSLLEGDGTALVLHEGTDDYETDPSGDAGGRIACGVIRR